MAGAESKAGGTGTVGVSTVGREASAGPLCSIGAVLPGFGSEAALASSFPGRRPVRGVDGPQWRVSFEADDVSHRPG